MSSTRKKFVFKGPFTVSVIRNVIQKLGANNVIDGKGLQVEFIKKGIKALTNPITHLLNEVVC